MFWVITLMFWVITLMFWVITLLFGILVDDDDDHLDNPTPFQPFAPRKKTRREAQDPHLDLCLCMDC